MAKPRVLIVTSWYPNQGNPVYGTFVREQARALAGSGEAEVALFYPSDPEVRSGLSTAGDEDGIRTYRANFRFAGNLLQYLAGGLKAVAELRRLIRAYKPDIVHVHVCFPAGILTWLAVRGLSVPYIITEHMSYLHEYTTKPHYRLLLRKAYESAAKVLVVSPYLARQFDGLGWKIKPESFPNMVDTGRFSLGADSAAAGQNEAPDSVHILFAGGLDRREIKGVQYLLPALAEVVATGADKKPHLHIVGDGVKRADYERTVQELGIADYVTFHGAVAPQDIPGFYHRCDFFVLPSLQETFGVVLIEAMACGKPVLATACGGPESIVTPETGILVAKESTPALAQGLRTMLANCTAYSPEVLRRYAEEHYSAEVLAKRLVEMYRHILTLNEIQ